MIGVMAVWTALVAHGEEAGGQPGPNAVSAQAIPAAWKRPAVMVILPETHMAAPQSGELAGESEMARQLQAAGFERVKSDGRNIASLKAATAYAAAQKAEVLLYGQAMSEYSAAQSGSVVCSGRIEVKAVCVKTEEIIAERDAASEAQDRVELEAGRKALQQAAAKLAGPLLLTVAQKWNGVRQPAATQTAIAPVASAAAKAKPIAFPIESTALSVGLSADGEITGQFAARTELAGCHVEGLVAMKTVAVGGRAFTRTWVDESGHRCAVTDRFTPHRDGVRWEIELVSDGAPWSTAIVTRLNYPVTAATQYWTTWGLPSDDPLEWQTAGAGNYAMQKTPGAVRLSIPIFSIGEIAQDKALTLVQSPEDMLLDVTLTSTRSGEIRLSRLNHRLGGGKAVRFALDIISHAADPRAALGWMVKRYPKFFEPAIPQVNQISGCGAYTGDESLVDGERLRKMGFAFNGKCGEDFPYMGLFIPPVADAQTRWTRAPDEKTPGKPAWTSLQTLNDYNRRMRADGFHVLNYFNVTEYGRNMTYPAPPRRAASEADLWKDPHDFFYYGGLSSAVMFKGTNVMHSDCYKALIVDPGDPTYQRHLLEQVERHIRQLPDSSGLYIDRMDWLEFYNPNADDGVSWVNGKPVRSLYESWRGLMARMMPMLHGAGKVVFANNICARIDMVGLIDGIYAEAPYSSARHPYMGYSALTGVCKPVTIWTVKDEQVTDEYLQRCLFLGIFPTAPYPNNNHSLRPSEKADAQFLAYGPLLNAIRGRKWVLEAHCIESDTPGVKANLFDVPGGYAIPVAFGGQAASATVRVRGVPGLEKLKWEALQPGVAAAVPVPGQFKDGAWELAVPLARGGAVVRTRCKE